MLIFAASLPKLAFNSSLLTEATYLCSVSSTISKVASCSPACTSISSLVFSQNFPSLYNKFNIEVDSLTAALNGGVGLS